MTSVQCGIPHFSQFFFRYPHYACSKSLSLPHSAFRMFGIFSAFCSVFPHSAHTEFVIFAHSDGIKLSFPHSSGEYTCVTEVAVYTLGLLYIYTRVTVRLVAFSYVFLDWICNCVTVVIHLIAVVGIESFGFRAGRNSAFPAFSVAHFTSAFRMFARQFRVPHPHIYR